MDYTTVSSSNIAAVAYDSDQALLGVQFVNGTEYHYFGVPPDVYNALLGAPSVGQYFNTYVRKGGYAFQRVG